MKPHQVFAFEVGQLDILELSVDNGGSLKIRSRFLNLRSHLELPVEWRMKERALKHIKQVNLTYDHECKAESKRNDDKEQNERR